MSEYRRWRAGRCFFFTVVTHERRPILTTEVGRSALRRAVQAVRRDRPFSITAIVLLPDHLHTVWQLPEGDADYSVRWRRIKSLFTRDWIANDRPTGAVTMSRIMRQEQGVWQRRFYEHTCRDEDDMQRCIDYVHVNPVKHRLVERVVDWPWSSFHRFVRLGLYPSEWGASTDWFGDELRRFE